MEQLQTGHLVNVGGDVRKLQHLLLDISHRLVVSSVEKAGGCKLQSVFFNKRLCVERDTSFDFEPRRVVFD